MGVVIFAIAVLVATSVVAWRSQSGALESVVGSARVTASSTSTGTSPRDAVTPGGPGWRSNGETIGAWLDLSWAEQQTVHRITIIRNPLEQPGITDGYLSFGDGSYLQVRLSTTSRTTTVPITPRALERLRFTATAVDEGARDVQIARVAVGTSPGPRDVAVDDRVDGNAAPNGAVTTDATGTDPDALVDGSGIAGAEGVGAEWAVPEPRRGTFVEIRWGAPREISSIELTGGMGPGATVAAARLSFDDGTSVPVGAVLAEPDRPTVVAFMPRVVSSVRLTVDELAGAGPLVLAELRTYRRGATPGRAQAPSSATSPVVTPPAAMCPTGAPPPAPSALTVTCPAMGAASGDTVTLQAVAAAGHTQITTRVLPGSPASPSPEPVTARASSAGPTSLPLDLSGHPPGPLTVAVEASGPGRPVESVYLQLYRPGRTRPHPSDAPASGRTLVYAEEFDRPVSLSRDGRGADYASAKPTDDGAEDFGDAVFSDPAAGLGNVGVVDGFLHLGVAPLPPGHQDPQGWGPQHLGGLVASARPGGSGFSAQFGYFEARMFAPAAEGTWPAFWMLPADNLIRPTPSVAEIDVVELYGRFPAGACHSTHEFRAGDDGGTGQCSENRFPSPEVALAWHTYSVSILPSGITFYIDGKVVATAPQIDGGAAPMFFLVDLALGGGWPVDLRPVGERAALYVDYVRVYV